MNRARKWQIASTALLCLVVIDDIAQVSALLRRISIAGKLLDDPLSVSLDTAQASDHFVRTTAGFYLLLLAATAATFITWMAILAKQAEQTRPNALRHSSGWAIGAWFVPFLNLVRPGQIINDLCSVSEPEGSPRKLSPLVGWWWGVFVCDSVIGRIVYASTSQGDGLRSLRTGAQIALVNTLVDIAAAVLAISVLRALTRRAATWRPSVSAWGGYSYAVGQQPPPGMPPYGPPPGPPPPGMPPYGAPPPGMPPYGPPPGVPPQGPSPQSAPPVAWQGDAGQPPPPA